MPIKWNITGKAMKARGLMDKINAEYDGLIEGAEEHHADVKGLRAQVDEMQDDLQSAANIMGNSAGASGESQDSSDGHSAVKLADLAKGAPAVTTSPQEAQSPLTNGSGIAPAEPRNQDGAANVAVK